MKGAQTPAGDVPVLEARGICKRFNRVEALTGADFHVSQGLITALVGDNGAGKSTLIKVICGVEIPDEGDIILDGSLTRFQSPADARSAGIETIFQDLAIAPHLSAAANVFMGREILRPGFLGRLGVLDKRAMTAQAGEVLSRLGVRIKNPGAPLNTLSGGQQQGVAVARGAAFATRIILMDEPTAALGVTQTAQVHRLIRSVRSHGIAVVLISHDIPEVMELADEVSVMRHGRRVAHLKTRETSAEEIVGLMAGTIELEGVRR